MTDEQQTPDAFIVPTTKTASARTAQEWVDFYLDLESEVAEAKSVRSDDLNRTVEMHDLDEIRRARREWQRAVTNQKRLASGAKTCGGLFYKTADLTR